jgi:hypothetical protein
MILACFGGEQHRKRSCARHLQVLAVSFALRCSAAELAAQLVLSPLCSATPHLTSNCSARFIALARCANLLPTRACRWILLLRSAAGGGNAAEACLWQARTPLLEDMYEGVSFCIWPSSCCCEACKGEYYILPLLKL